jgi:hypothetical protein
MKVPKDVMDEINRDAFSEAIWSNFDIAITMIVTGMLLWGLIRYRKWLGYAELRGSFAMVVFKSTRTKSIRKWKRKQMGLT